MTFPPLTAFIHPTHTTSPRLFRSRVLFNPFKSSGGGYDDDDDDDGVV